MTTKEIRDKVEDVYIKETGRVAFLDENKLDDRYVEWLENQVMNNFVLDLVSDCKKLNIHECLNDLEKVIEIKTGVLDFIDKGSLRYQLKKAIDKMICCR